MRYSGAFARFARSGLLLGVAAALLISLTNVFSRLHFEAGSNPVTFMLARYILFVGVVAGCFALTAGLPRVPKHRYVDIVIAGLLNVSGATCLAFAIERLQVSLAIAVLYLFPIFTLLIDSGVRRKLPSKITLAALLLALAGLVLALDVRTSQPDPTGVVLALCAALGVSASFVWIDWRLEDVRDGARILGLGVVALVAMIVFALLDGGVVWPLPSAWAWLTLLIATATFGTAYSAIFLAIARAGAPKTSTLMNLEPPATAVFAALLLGDRLDAMQAIGIALVIVAVILAQRHALQATERRA